VCVQQEGGKGVRTLGPVCAHEWISPSACQSPEASQGVTNTRWTEPLHCPVAVATRLSTSEYQNQLTSGGHRPTVARQGPWFHRV